MGSRSLNCQTVKRCTRKHTKIPEQWSKESSSYIKVHIENIVFCHSWNLQLLWHTRSASHGAGCAMFRWQDAKTGLESMGKWNPFLPSAHIIWLLWVLALFDKVKSGKAFKKYRRDKLEAYWKVVFISATLLCQATVCWQGMHIVDHSINLCINSWCF